MSACRATSPFNLPQEYLQEIAKSSSLLMDHQCQRHDFIWSPEDLLTHISRTDVMIQANEDPYDRNFVWVPTWGVGSIVIFYSSLRIGLFVGESSVGETSCRRNVRTPFLRHMVVGRTLLQTCSVLTDHNKPMQVILQAQDWATS